MCACVQSVRHTEKKLLNFFFLNFIYLFIYLWLCWVFVSVLGLSLVAASGGHSSSRCAGLLTIAASPVAAHRLQTRRLSNCGSRAQLLRGMWGLPRPGLEPVSPALAGRFSTTAPPGKPGNRLLKKIQGFPGGAVVGSLPAGAGDTGLSPGLGGSHMPRSN